MAHPIRSERARAANPDRRAARRSRSGFGSGTVLTPLPGAAGILQSYNGRLGAMEKVQATG